MHSGINERMRITNSDSPGQVKLLCVAMFLASTSLSLLVTSSASAQTERQLTAARREMVESAIIASGVKNEKVIESMLNTKRHEFVDRRFRRQAYFDSSLPIGESQTISSPFIVAYMTESLDPQPDDVVLEIGTGSGYQAAILSPLVKEVYTIEIVESLGNQAKKTLERLDYENVHVKVGDGFKGWPEHAPFDKIIVTCSPEKVPVPLVEQLRDGGLMVVPVGERYQQTLYLMRKKNGELVSESLRPTLFVPMTGTAEDQREVQPDPNRPNIANGDFEEGVDEAGFVKGWYYQRQTTWEEDELAPSGDHFVRFENKDEGRSSHLMQGFPINGERIKAIQLSGSIRTELVFPGKGEFDMPVIAVTFYNENRKQMAAEFIGPFVGSRDWRPVRKVIAVPPEAREAIVRIGLFGATGTADFDNIRIEPTRPE